MKKFICLLTILVMTAPAWATITFTVTQGVDPCDVTIGYTSDGGTPVGVSLEVSLDNGVEIHSASIPVDPCFNAYIDYLHDNPPLPTDELPLGLPLAKQGAVAGYPALPLGDVSLCMGRLVADHTPGPTPCELVTLRVDPCGVDSCTLTLSLDDNRGGVVDANGDPLVTTADDPCSYTLTFEPSCWSYDCFACGDGDGNCFITAGDVQILLGCWGGLPYNPCGDFDKNGFITAGDVQILLNHWAGSATPACWAGHGCSPCTPQ